VGFSLPTTEGGKEKMTGGLYWAFGFSFSCGGETPFRRLPGFLVKRSHWVTFCGEKIGLALRKNVGERSIIPTSCP